MRHREFLVELMERYEVTLTIPEVRAKLYEEAELYDIVLSNVSEDCVRSNVLQLLLKFWDEEHWRAVVERNRR